MGGMHCWMWGEMYPGFMDALVPIASQPIEISGRNWIGRRIAIEAIRRDPDWNEGNYTKKPTHYIYTAPYGALMTENPVRLQELGGTPGGGGRALPEVCRRGRAGATPTTSSTPPRR